MIRLDSLSFQYPKTTQPVLKDINLDLKPGTINLVTGRTGSGKSTLLRCLNGLVPHFSGGAISGKINVFGFNPIQEGPQKMAAIVGFIFQEPEAQFVFDLVEDEIAFALENAAIPREEMQHKVDQILRELGLWNIRKKHVHQLSGGEKQKVAIASVLVNTPKVLILDEPTSQLDPISADELLKFIINLRDQLGLTVLISEHRLERLLPYTENIIHLISENGILFGSPQAVIPQMDQLPPMLQLAKRVDISPLPLRVNDFPKRSTLSFDLKIKTVQQKTLPKKSVILDISDLSVSLAGRQILKKNNLQLLKGEILTLIGPNGAGKTTLLRSILNLVPSDGQIRLKGQKTHTMDITEIIQHIAYLPQNPNDLLFADSVWDELMITLKNHKIDKNKNEISAFLGQFGLEDKKDKYPRDLSVGERQKTALAAISVHQPTILLLDEPTRGLDYDSKEALRNILTEWRNQGKSILLITQDIEFAARIADQVAILEEGVIAFHGHPRIAFTKFPAYRTQIARIFPNTPFITIEDIHW